ncbi:Hypothetical protein SMAX5B_011061 [Scophthalmus maximus]|uniref:Uncharacterized protein n=1 Tax=Scophthalmus maximus TaxID=52904 RepID=A0A2U9BS38_SCOMX|nr:Hypothetical protein SMAX5B_011061 [Scophthalmus maximus]
MRPRWTRAPPSGRYEQHTVRSHADESERTTGTGALFAAHTAAVSCCLAGKILQQVYR